MKALLETLLADMRKLHARIEELEARFCRPSGNPSLPGSAPQVGGPAFISFQDPQAQIILDLNPKR